MKAEAQQEKDEMLAMIRAAKREVGLQTLIIDSYIPHEYQEQLESVVQWQEETGEWHMVSQALLSYKNLFPPCISAWNTVCWQQHEEAENSRT